MSPAFFPLPLDDHEAEERFESERTGTHASTGTHVSKADALRAKIEASLGSPGALTPAKRQVQETMATGIAELDAALNAGLPIGAITELVGPLSSGRTGVAMSTVAAAMRAGNLCAWVDASDAFDPESAAANGVFLEQLLWVRCGVQGSHDSGQGGSCPVQQGTAHKGSTGLQSPQARAGQHPRDEVRGLDTAVGELLREGTGGSRRDRSIGTPGAPNRALSAHGDAGRANSARGSRSFGPVQREEQVSSDRQPRRGRGGAGEQPALAQSPVPQAVKLAQRAGDGPKPWARLDQALRAVDLLLQGGGFRVLVLDLGNIAPEHALRIPLASWFRFRAAAEANRIVLLALTQTSCARSSAGLVVNFGALQAQLSTTEAGMQAPSADLHAVPLGGLAKPVASSGTSIIQSVLYQAQPIRQRFTPSAQPVAINHRVGPRPPQATWQRSAYPVREQA